MGRREYVGTGGMRLLLDDPPTGEMAKQIARGHLVPVSGDTPDVEAGDKSLVVVHGSEANTADRFGAHRPAVGEKPDARDGTPKEWATYAVSLGMEGTHASTLSLAQLQEWVQAHEGALGEREAAPVPAEDPKSPAAPASDVPDKPAANAKVADWRLYAIALGMDADTAKDATKTECQDYAAVVEEARESEQSDSEVTE
ncbi:hypothetical protein [Streptomyces sp. 4R-3d]|uniref:hypothetical protein n=1 Tax=Streptomyces sp. 4R-3d TaxID=2559605 RepID=UPI001071990B|nr:hypothetical protein [Streptomyces sp. 4R-3d]TFI30160.1 hypothetical protein E4P36_05270 [Streptomyces sp. 4R-3d]